MADSYSDQLRVTLIEVGQHDATWGTALNTNVELLEASISGRAAVTHDDTANYTLTTANGSDDEARHMILNIGGALGAARNVVVPTKSKLYVVNNATTGGFAVTVKTSAGTGISVPNGKTMILFCDGTNVVEAINQVVGALALTSPAITTSITTPSTTFTAFAGATTLLTLGGTGDTSVVAIPGTLDATNSTTAGFTLAGGLAVAKSAFIGANLTVGTGTGTIGWGTYTPTITNGTNVAASTSQLAQYMRVGNTVTVGGSLLIDPTTTGTTNWEIDLPIASNFAQTYHCSGTFVDDTGYAAGNIQANGATDRAVFQYSTATTSNHQHRFHFTYQVI